tara:strand:- start:360 stop:1013 length:654 start_codon:yes stop_codon:yes gene_type:complete
VESYKEIKTYYSRKDTQNLTEYEKDHLPRLDFLIKDLGLDNLRNLKICDFGCGGGYILKKIKDSNEVIAIDGYDVKDSEITREVYNLDEPFSEAFISKYGTIDAAFSFEMFEHLTNPYNFIFELKKVLKEGGTLYFSVPHEATQHNTFYPGLIYPVQNLIQFFEQMAFKIKDHKIHSKRFVQNVLVLENRSWDHVKMLWPKPGKSFQGQPPHIQVNL